MSDKKLSSYVGVCEDYRTEEIVVWERDETGRHAVRYPAPYYFYVPTEGQSQYTSMFGDSLLKLTFETKEEFNAARAQYPIKFESDFSALDKCLMDVYYGRPIPSINCCMLDIEVDVDDEGFARPRDARLPINAITLYHQWTDTFYCIAVPPPDWDGVEFVPDTTEFDYDKIERLEFFIAENEAELLMMFLELIEDVDFLTGWNSEFFDLPYLYSRILLLFGENGVRQLCFPGAGKPKVREVERFKNLEMTVILSGRSHLDYLAMFKKFTFEGRSSYALAAICEEELGASKLEYDGSLKDLYRNDFKHFCTYNIIDVLLLKKLDKKFNFVALVNQMAHENTVQFDAILGTTRYVDSGTTNFAHHYLKMIVKDKGEASKHGKVEGAIVMTPNKGLHKWIGSVDINSLYPSVLRSGNMSPETCIGQFNTEETVLRMYELAETQALVEQAKKAGYDLSTFFFSMAKEYDWKGIFEKDHHPHTAFIEGKFVTKTGAEWNDYLRKRKWFVSAYGTIFDQGGPKGVVPSVLEYWYFERKKLQKELKEWKKKAKSLREHYVEV